MALEVATWILLLAFIAATIGLCEICERIVSAVEKRRAH